MGVMKKLHTEINEGNRTRCVSCINSEPRVSTGLPKQDSGHWWSSFFFGKQPGMSPLTEEK